VPDVVESGLYLLHQRHDGEEEKGQSDRPENSHVEVLHKADDLHRQLFALGTEGSQKIGEHRLNLVVNPESLQDGETHGEKGDQREEGGVDEAHGPQADEALREILDAHGDQAQKLDQKGLRPRKALEGDLPESFHQEGSCFLQVPDHLPRFTRSYVTCAREPRPKARTPPTP
jgi:hypothetical protein